MNVSKRVIKQTYFNWMALKLRKCLIKRFYSRFMFTNNAVDGVEDREGEREIGESETNIFKPNQTIHLGSKVTLSSFGNL